MTLTAFWGIQRIPQSLWDDEDSSLHRAVLGQYRRDKSGELKLRETTWETALWNYWKPANHQLQTVLSKACLESWQAVARPIGLQFSETAVRIPCLVAGVLSVGALALLLKRLGFPVRASSPPFFSRCIPGMCVMPLSFAAIFSPSSLDP